VVVHKDGWSQIMLMSIQTDSPVPIYEQNGQGHHIFPKYLQF